MMAANPLASLSDPGDGPRVTVYSISGCRHCKAAKALLGERLVGITGADGQPAQFVDVTLETYPVLRPVVAELTGKKTVPQIFFNEKHIGGNDQLQVGSASCFAFCVRRLKVALVFSPFGFPFPPEITGYENGWEFRR